MAAQLVFVVLRRSTVALRAFRGCLSLTTGRRAIKRVGRYQLGCLWRLRWGFFGAEGCSRRSVSWVSEARYASGQMEEKASTLR